MPISISTPVGMPRPKPQPSRIEQEVEGAAAVQQSLDPSLKNVTVKPMGPLAKLLMGRTGALAKHVALLPGQNTVYYNPDAIRKARTEGHAPSVDALMAHEMEHGRQRNERGYFGYLWDALVKEPQHAYGMGPLEGAALDVENETWKKVMRRDQQLLAESVSALQRRTGR